MGLSKIIFGHDGQKLPYDVRIVYSNGTTGALHIFADDMRKALLDANYWMPLHLPARSVTITERVK